VYYSVAIWVSISIPVFLCFVSYENQFRLRIMYYDPLSKQFKCLFSIPIDSSLKSAHVRYRIPVTNNLDPTSASRVDSGDDRQQLLVSRLLSISTRFAASSTTPYLYERASCLLHSPQAARIPTSSRAEQGVRTIPVPVRGPTPAPAEHVRRRESLLESAALAPHRLYICTPRERKCSRC